MNTTFPSHSSLNRYILKEGNIRLIAIDATDLCQVLSRIHQLDEHSTRGFSEAILGALFISSTQKEGEIINLSAVGSGDYKQAVIDVHPGGQVRGFFVRQSNPELRTYGVDGKAGAWGTGVLSVLYTQREDGQTPYTGRVAISDGHLESAVNTYFEQSAQLPTRVAISVHESQNEFWARGLMVQALGEATEEERAWVLSAKGKGFSHLASLTDNIGVLEKEMRREWKSHAFKSLDKMPLAGFCTCDQERIERALLLMGREEAEKYVTGQGFIELTCDFCQQKYTVTAERLHDIFNAKTQMH